MFKTLWNSENHDLRRGTLSARVNNGPTIQWLSAWVYMWAATGFWYEQSVWRNKTFKKNEIKTKKSTNLDLQNFHRSLSYVVGIIQGEFIVSRNDFQFESVTFLPVVAPEIVLVIVQFVFVSLESESSCIAPSNALQC